MKLKKRSTTLPEKTYKCVLSGALSQQLIAYAHYYEATYQEAIEPDALISEMIEAFVYNDRQFQAHLKQTQLDHT